MMFKYSFNSGRTPDASRVDKEKRVPVNLYRHFDGITGGAGTLIDDCTGKAGQPIEQGRLADVGTADQGKAQDGGTFRLGVASRQQRAYLVEQFSYPAPMSGRNESD